MGRKYKVMILTGVMAASLMGCVSNPEQAVVKEKNLDKVLEQAENTEDGAVVYEDVEKKMENYDTYETHIQDDDLHVTVDVNAKVEIPKVDRLSVYRASQKKIDEKLLHKVQELLAPGMTFYDGSKAEQDTKEDIAEEIQALKKSIANLKVGEDGIANEESLQAYKKEDEECIAELETEYKKAPDHMDVTAYPSDNALHNVKELYDAQPDNNFLKWAYDLNPDGQMYYGVNDAADDNYVSVYVQNNEDSGNCIRYCRNRNMYAHWAKVAVAGGTEIFSSVPYEKGKDPDWWDGMEYDQTTRETANLSQEDARKQADALIDKLGMSEFECKDESCRAQQYEGIKGNDSDEYRVVYQFVYLRKLDGVTVDNRAGEKFIDEWQGDEYVKKSWGSESIVVAVNDDGIVEFEYGYPMSIDEKVVEQSSIKSFDEIRDTFEEMVVIQNAPTEDTGKTVIDITNVNLVYTRISEKDRFDTGLIVPVWDFEGTIVDEYGTEQTGNILSINAIDGTVINRTLGY